MTEGIGEDALARAISYNRKGRDVDFTLFRKNTIMVPLTRDSRTCPVTAAIPGVALWF